MHPRAFSSTLNVQPRQRREIYERLAQQSAGCSARRLRDHASETVNSTRRATKALPEAAALEREGPDRQQTTELVESVAAFAKLSRILKLTAAIRAVALGLQTR